MCCIAVASVESLVVLPLLDRGLNEVHLTYDPPMLPAPPHTHTHFHNDTEKRTLVVHVLYYIVVYCSIYFLEIPIIVIYLRTFFLSLFCSTDSIWLFDNFRFVQVSVYLLSLFHHLGGFLLCFKITTD